jgi:heme exporter protein C
VGEDRLLLWFIFLGYFLVRASTENPERGKRFSAVVGIVGALDIPLIHLSVLWFRSLHPGPVVFASSGPALAPPMSITLGVGFLSMLLVFLGVFAFRYALEAANRAAEVRGRAAA